MASAAIFGQDLPPDKRAYGVLPNYRTVEPGVRTEPLTSKQKFTIAAKDSFDYPIFFVAGALSGIGHLQNQNPSFGQGAEGYLKRYAAGYADQAMGNFMVEGALPTLLHQDPRYFRKGSGSVASRTTYALSRVLVTRNDRGRLRPNYSEIVGNSMVAGIGNLYYKDATTLGDNAGRAIAFTATDAIGNVLKEFWPDVKRRFKKR